MSTAATPRSLNPDVPDGWGMVQIPTLDHQRAIPASVLRPLCVHGGWADTQGAYIVSHLATGRRFFSFPEHVQAMGFAREFRQLLDVGGFEDSADPEEVVSRILAIVPKDELRELRKRHGGLR